MNRTGVSAGERHLYSKLRKLQRCINNHNDHNNKTANREKNEAGQIKVAKKLLVVLCTTTMAESSTRP